MALSLGGQRPSFPLCLQGTLFQVASEVTLWQIGSTSSALCRSLHKLISRYLLIGLFYLILLHTLLTFIRPTCRFLRYGWLLLACHFHSSSDEPGKTKMHGPNKSPSYHHKRSQSGASQVIHVVNIVLQWLSFVPLALTLSYKMLAFSHTVSD